MVGYRSIPNVICKVMAVLLTFSSTASLEAADAPQQTAALALAFTSVYTTAATDLAKVPVSK